MRQWPEAVALTLDFDFFLGLLFLSYIVYDSVLVSITQHRPTILII